MILILDIDYCTRSLDDCGQKPHTECVNDPQGTFTCDCVEGYARVGDSNSPCQCKLIDSVSSLNSYVLQPCIRFMCCNYIFKYLSSILFENLPLCSVHEMPLNDAELTLLAHFCQDWSS